MPTQRREEKRVGECASEQGEGERDPRPFGSSFYMFFSSPWACPMKIELAGSVVCSS